MPPWSDKGGHTTSPSKGTTQHPQPKGMHIPAPHPHPDRATPGCVPRQCPLPGPHVSYPWATSPSRNHAMFLYSVPIQCPHPAPCAMSPCPVSGPHAEPVPCPHAVSPFTVSPYSPHMGAVPCPHAGSLCHTPVSRCHAVFGAMPPRGHIPSVPPRSALCKWGPYHVPTQHPCLYVTRGAVPCPHAVSHSQVRAVPRPCARSPG